MAHRRFAATHSVRQRLLELHQVKAQERLHAALLNYGIEPPNPFPRVEDDVVSPRYLIDREKQRAFNAYIRRSGCTLPEFVRLLHNESADDPRPNKALEIPSHHAAWSSYPHGKLW